MSDSVALLAEPVRRWIHQQGWTRLRDVQEKAIPVVLDGGDVVISARTAAGKTQAALLPVAYYTGDDVQPARRVPAAKGTSWNSWASKGKKKKKPPAKLT